MLTAPVRMLAGQQDVAVQLLEQSPVKFDETILWDLMANHAQKLNVQVQAQSIAQVTSFALTTPAFG